MTRILACVYLFGFAVSVLAIVDLGLDWGMPALLCAVVFGAAFASCGLGREGEVTLKRLLLRQVVGRLWWLPPFAPGSKTPANQATAWARNLWRRWRGVPEIPGAGWE
jgi:hypothetical protein